MKNIRRNGGVESLPVVDPRFAAYIKRLVDLIESGQAIDSDKRAAAQALKRIDDALACGDVPFHHVETVKRSARILELTLD